MEVDGIGRGGIVPIACISLSLSVLEDTSCLQMDASSQWAGDFQHGRFMRPEGGQV